MRPDTELIHFDACPEDPHRPTSTPIYQTATFEQADPESFGRYDYTRSGNPTRTVLQDQLARLERAASATAFASGMAAISAVTRLVRPGERILAGSDLYGGTYRLLSKVVEPLGIGVDHADTSDPAALVDSLTDRTRLVLIETPTNPMQRVTDIASAAEAAHERGALLAVDNTMLSPHLMRPLTLGADIVIHSATKYLCGHADVTAGVVAVRDAGLAERVAFLANAEGTALAPFEAWLLLRGLKTLSVRIERQQAGAASVAGFLRGDPRIERVRYVGLPDHPGHAVHAAQASGSGAVLAFETGWRAVSREVVAATRLFTTSVSFGSIASTISLPACMSHASIPENVRHARALPDDLVRISVGLEDPRDLVEDLDRALDAATRASSHVRTVARSAPVAG